MLLAGINLNPPRRSDAGWGATKLDDPGGRSDDPEMQALLSEQAELKRRLLDRQAELARQREIQRLRQENQELREELAALDPPGPGA